MRHSSVVGLVIYLYCNLLLVVLGCDKSPATSSTNPDGDSIQAIHNEWSEWSEETAQGLWEGQEGHISALCLVDTIHGETAENINFYSCRAFAIRGDTLFIIDNVVNQLVCMNIDGTLIWKYGGDGEGPGHFNCLNSVCVGPNWIAVGDALLSKIEILNRSGELIRIITEENPTSLVTINDTTFAVLSRIAEGGDIHLYSTNSGYLESFGQGSWNTNEAYWHLELYGDYLAQDNSLWIVSCMENQLFRYDLATRTTSDNFAKPLPSEFLEPEEVEGGVRVYAVLGDIFIGPENQVNVLIGAIGFTPNGDMRRSLDEARIPYEIVDRYNSEGKYLDSYCIPNQLDFVNQIVFSPQYGYLCSVENLGCILRYEIVE